MCFDTKTKVLADLLKPHMKVGSAKEAAEMITEHTQLSNGRRPSRVMELAMDFYGSPAKFGIATKLRDIRGCQKSALREAIMLNLREMSGTPVSA